MNLQVDDEAYTKIYRYFRDNGKSSLETYLGEGTDLIVVLRYSAKYDSRQLENAIKYIEDELSAKLKMIEGNTSDVDYVKLTFKR